MSGAPLSGSSTFANQTLASLGVTPGSYVWTWGSGANADSPTLNIIAPAVPEPSSLVLAGMGSLAAFGRVWGRRRAVA